jgi:hypothetical protein
MEALVLLIIVAGLALFGGAALAWGEDSREDAPGSLLR